MERIERFESVETFIEDFKIKDGDVVCGNGFILLRNIEFPHNDSRCTSERFTFKFVKDEHEKIILEECCVPKGNVFIGDMTTFFYNQSERYLVMCGCREINEKMALQVCTLCDVEIKRV